LQAKKVRWAASAMWGNPRIWNKTHNLRYQSDNFGLRIVEFCNVGAQNNMHFRIVSLLRMHQNRAEGLHPAAGAPF